MAPSFPWLVEAKLPSPHGVLSTALPSSYKNSRHSCCEQGGGVPTSTCFDEEASSLWLSQRKEGTVSEENCQFCEQEILLLSFGYLSSNRCHKTSPLSSAHISVDQFPGKVTHKKSGPGPGPILNVWPGSQPISTMSGFHSPYETHSNQKPAPGLWTCDQAEQEETLRTLQLQISLTAEAKICMHYVPGNPKTPKGLAQGPHTMTW